MRSKLSRLYRAVENKLVDASTNRVMRGLAILITLVDLRREATAVVWGRFYSRTNEARAELTAFRRDVHRVEKGLVMRPRRLPFGKEYIPALVDTLARLKGAGSIPAEDEGWAHDVLAMYFAVSENVTEGWFQRARARFVEAPRDGDGVTFAPAPRATATRSSVSLQDLRNLSERRRSVRWFEQNSVNPDLVDQALQIAALAPSACNRQNVRFHMVYGTKKTKSVLTTVGGTRGFADQVPAVAVVIGRLAGYRYGFDRHAIFVDGGLASMGFLYGLETVGLSSCCINWPDVGSRYDAIRRIVDMREDEQVIMLIAVGTADPSGLVPSSRKRGLREFRTQDAGGTEE